MPQHMPTACIATPFLTLHLALPRSTSHPQKEFEDASEEPLKKKTTHPRNGGPPPCGFICFSVDALYAMHPCRAAPPAVRGGRRPSCCTPYLPAPKLTLDVTQLFAIVPINQLGMSPVPNTPDCSNQYAPFHNNNFQGSSSGDALQYWMAGSMDSPYYNCGGMKGNEVVIM